MNELQISTSLLTWLIILCVWSMVWKGIALWKSAKNKDLAWFIIMFIINTAGILEIIYIFAVCCRDNKECYKDDKKEK